MSSARRQLDVRLDPVLRHRMLVPVEAELLQHPPDLQRLFIDVIRAPRVVHQHHVVADRLADQMADLDVPLDVRWPPGHRLAGRRVPVVVRVDLVREVPLLFAGQCVLGIVLRRAHVRVGAARTP